MHLRNAHSARRHTRARPAGSRAGLELLGVGEGYEQVDNEGDPPDQADEVLDANHQVLRLLEPIGVLDRRARRLRRGAPVAHDAVQGQLPVADRPPGRAQTDLAGSGGRDGQHRAAGMREAVAAYPAVPHPAQRAAQAGADNQEVVVGVRGLDERQARLAADDDKREVQVRPVKGGVLNCGLLDVGRL
jgi:hypothetical protein